MATAVEQSATSWEAVWGKKSSKLQMNQAFTEGNICFQVPGWLLSKKITEILSYNT